jgi:hypothetical protein
MSIFYRNFTTTFPAETRKMALLEIGGMGPEATAYS